MESILLKLVIGFIQYWKYIIFGGHIAKLEIESDAQLDWKSTLYHRRGLGNERDCNDMQKKTNKKQHATYANIMEFCAIWNMKWNENQFVELNCPLVVTRYRVVCDVHWLFPWEICENMIPLRNSENMIPCLYQPRPPTSID